jgi:hypothetical protein
MSESLSLRELEALYSTLTTIEREDLLQELVVAASQGGDAMIVVLEAWLLDRAVRKTIQEL